ncbi:WD40/YVTN/BNR-like repeat-containing protein [Nocardioides houyundeii]|uniref:WD40/YVTN/BNR-like repeat-containing protein n=1 Tax=Nocardioides houyundeii TaxID=2045452 RepID=UPI000DF1F7F9|nr:exo-alpha-sialidase [Nocardioides houyundeii]
MTTTLLLVGTRKGLWIGTSDEARRDWSWTGPHFPMEEVYSVLLDGRGDRPRLFAGCSSSWFGPQVRRSDDLGQTWEETPNGAVRFPDDTGAALERVWQLVPGVEDGVIWAGTEPGAVFRSEDRGERFELVRGLWEHPQRSEWGEGFGGQAFHTILPHPSDPGSVLAAISTGGVYRSVDGGAKWAPANQGIKAEFMPGDRHFPEFGQCVHKVARDPVDPARLFLQNHGGVYRSDDEGDSWEYIADGLPSEFGFAMVTHPRKPATAFVFPIADAGARWPVDGHARVFRTADGGDSWAELGSGSLPDAYFAAVMRDAMCADTLDPAGLYFGGRNGAVWASADEGETWQEVHKDLPDVLVVRAAVLA